MSTQDSNFIQISAVDQYIIDKVRAIRIDLDLSQKELSARISQSENNSLVGKAESPSTGHKYTDDHLFRIALVFSEEAKSLKKENPADPKYSDIQTEYTLLDFYPPTAVADQLVIKKRNVPDERIFPAGAVQFLIEETDFLRSPRTTREITEELNNIFQQTWKPSDLGSPLDRATAKGLLIKTEPPHTVTYKLRLK